ncbi:hypothetical protein B0H17DRAFT_1333044 [Mycena rosella]|uniref:Uncharacterized protein n=1 Tax=Mycena rosella TaxID=1033263 RepID=A0AAD7GAV8_MYCRO|nr:hypothetical protein B0H17DRAFT_1333044 [Mycena rosella]
MICGNFTPEAILSARGIIVNGVLSSILPPTMPSGARTSFDTHLLTIYGGMLIPSLTLKGPSAACIFVAFANTTSLLFSAFSACMFFCISLNLQYAPPPFAPGVQPPRRLVLVHYINNRTMEKYYIIVSVLLYAVCNITPLAAGRSGFYQHSDFSSLD